MHHDAAGPDRASPVQRVQHRGRGAFADHRVRGTDVDQVRRVHEDRAGPPRPAGPGSHRPRGPAAPRRRPAGTRSAGWTRTPGSPRRRCRRRSAARPRSRRPPGRARRPAAAASGGGGPGDRLPGPGRPGGGPAGPGAQPRLVRAYTASLLPSLYTRVKWSPKYDRRAGVQAMRRLLNRSDSHTYWACRNASRPGGVDRREPGRAGAGVPAVAQRVIRADRVDQVRAARRAGVEAVRGDEEGRLVAEDARARGHDALHGAERGRGDPRRHGTGPSGPAARPG